MSLGTRWPATCSRSAATSAISHASITFPLRRWAGDQHTSHLDVPVDHDLRHVVMKIWHGGQSVLPDRFLGVAIRPDRGRTLERIAGVRDCAGRLEPRLDAHIDQTPVRSTEETAITGSTAEKMGAATHVVRRCLAGSS